MRTYRKTLEFLAFEGDTSKIMHSGCSKCPQSSEMSDAKSLLFVGSENMGTKEGQLPSLICERRVRGIDGVANAR